MALQLDVQKGPRARSSKRVRVLVVDQDELFVYGLVELLRRRGSTDVVGMVGDVAEVHVLTARARPEVMILDSGAPGAIDLIRDLRQRGESTAVLLLTRVEDSARALEALRAGAGGYILRSSGVETLVAAIQAVGRGHAVISDTVAERVFPILAVRRTPRAPHDGLTEREREVIRLVTCGAAYWEIAGRMNVSYKTVRNYVSRIYHKLSIRDRSQIALYAVRNGLVNPADVNLG